MDERPKRLDSIPKHGWFSHLRIVRLPHCDRQWSDDNEIIMTLFDLDSLERKWFGNVKCHNLIYFIALLVNNLFFSFHFHFTWIVARASYLWNCKSDSRPFSVDWSRQTDKSGNCSPFLSHYWGRPMIHKFSASKQATRCHVCRTTIFFFHSYSNPSFQHCQCILTRSSLCQST